MPIPIHVGEIRRLIQKDQPQNSAGEDNISEDHLLNILNSNSSGKNPTFFKAFGHSEVFGLKNFIPDGGTVVEITEQVPLECENWTTGDDVEYREDGVLYVNLPEGFPIMTGSTSGDEAELGNKEQQQHEEAVASCSSAVVEEPVPIIESEIVVQEVAPAPVAKTPEVEPLRSMRNKNAEKISYAEIDEDDIFLKKHRHNLRPQKPNRAVHALKQQAKRRQKNKNVVSGAPQPQRTLSRRSTITSNGDIEVAFQPSVDHLQENPQTMKELLNSIPGFNLKKLQLKGQNKKFTNAQMIQQTKEGSINLDTPDSILTKVNLRTLLNKNTFTRLPPLYQFKLMQMLPQADYLYDDNKGLRLNSTAFNNEFFAKACHEWRERLVKGDFTPEALQKNSSDLARDKQRLDPWKLRHYEPLWGMKRCFQSNNLIPSDTTPPPRSSSRRSASTVKSESSTSSRESKTVREPAQRKSERRKAPPIRLLDYQEDFDNIFADTKPVPVAAVEPKSVISADSAPNVEEEATDNIVSEEIVNNESVTEDGVTDQRSSNNKSPRVTISDQSEEIQDLCDEPVIKKRKIDEVSSEDVTDNVDSIVFNDPILELDSKYDLSPEETCPENFMECQDDLQTLGEEELMQETEEEVKKELLDPEPFVEAVNDAVDEEQQEVEPENEDKSQLEHLVSEPKVENHNVVESESPVNEEEMKIETFEENSNNVTEADDNLVREDSVDDEAEEEKQDTVEDMEAESEDDSQYAPTLSSVEPLGSVESNVMSVEMAPPTLSPNYGSPQHDDLTDNTDNESTEMMDANDDQSDVKQEEDNIEESQLTPAKEEAIEESSAASVCDIKEETVSVSTASTPPATSSPVTTSITTFQLPTAPLSLQETKLHSSSSHSLSSSSLSSPPPNSEALLRSIDSSLSPQALSSITVRRV